MLLDQSETFETNLFTWLSANFSTASSSDSKPEILGLVVVVVKRGDCIENSVCSYYSKDGAVDGCKVLSLLEECSTVGGEDDCKGELNLLVVFHSNEEDD